MAKRNIQEAKASLSVLIKLANTEGPQIITRHGCDYAVLLSITDYRALTVQQINFIDYLLGGPRVDGFGVRRSRDMGRGQRF